jgi:DNA-binding MarR family transcriptional regulator
MGLLDDMAAANKEQHEKPHGWKSTQEFADQMGVSWAKAKRILKGLEQRGRTLTTERPPRYTANLHNHFPRPPLAR